MTRGFITGNIVLDLAIAAWFIAQVLKVIINLVVMRKVDLHLLMSSGGMPSSHSALVCACATSLGMLYGLNSPAFAVAVVMALVVMYDACNVRRAAGEQAKILNYIIDHWTEMSPAMMGQELKELLGHTPLQVLMGALLGIAVGISGPVLLAG